MAKLTIILNSLSTYPTMILLLLHPHRLTVYLPFDPLTIYALQTRSVTSVTLHPSILSLSKRRAHMPTHLGLSTPHAFALTPITNLVCSPPSKFGAYVLNSRVGLQLDCPRRKPNSLRTSRPTIMNRTDTTHISHDFFSKYPNFSRYFAKIFANDSQIIHLDCRTRLELDKNLYFSKDLTFPRPQTCKCQYSTACPVAVLTSFLPCIEVLNCSYSDSSIFVLSYWPSSDSFFFSLLHLISPT